MADKLQRQDIPATLDPSLAVAPNPEVASLQAKFLALQIGELEEAIEKKRKDRAEHEAQRLQYAKDEKRRHEERSERQRTCQHIKNYHAGRIISAISGQWMPDGKFHGACARCHKEITGSMNEVDAMVPLGVIVEWESMGDVSSVRS